MSAERGAVLNEDMMEMAATRTVVLASADAALRERLRASLTGLRWQVREAAGGAEAMAQLEDARSEALLVDSWLPDLEVGEFATVIRMMYPAMELLRVDGGADGGARSPRRNELLHALREAQNAPLNDTAAWMAAPVSVPTSGVGSGSGVGARIPVRVTAVTTSPVRQREVSGRDAVDEVLRAIPESLVAAEVRAEAMLPEMVGTSEPMRELARLIRLVAPRSTTVLIEGETGTGKEVVARAVHRLSTRAGRSFTVLNCAAIPEALLEAELFGHTRGAFTGAVQSRTGRIEAAHGGTLFLDEIGEMPMALQAKMLRFLECGELQRVGDNETVRVDVRVVTATHQPLEKLASSVGAERTFRLDLYHRLAVFPVEVPALRQRMEDMAQLAEHFLEQMGQEMPRKRLSAEAKARLHEHSWPGNVRELMHVLERAAILAGDRLEIGAEEIRFRRATRG
ncbi:sigma 54-interacting transcriptional regulator [Granulicella sp. L60]|uniref:sigma 54-interacting transcriptional regulator n=1 Tax=Granulicella sp. L60 TaxID=1641866 RepID=UPI00131D565E|nr:sigma-54 dependent transcriptional regulator [Granulicella sp. L60]